VVRVEYGNIIAAVDEVIQPTATDVFIAPGFIDLQVNGFAGVDYNDPSASQEAIGRSIVRMFETGVTRFLPTIITGPESRITSALKNLAAFVLSDAIEAKAVAGFHVEGPHISPEDGPRGAHPREYVRPPDTAEFDRWQQAANGLIRLVTVSPEWPETPDYVRHLTRQGVVVSVGHTKANSDQIRAAVDAGATMSTHLGNATHPLLPKSDNYIWDQLAEDRLSAAFIVDGIHIPEAFFRACVRAKGIERSLLVTDAVMPAMCPPGPYRLGEVEVELNEHGVVTRRDNGRLAGSAVRMDRAVGNAVRMAGISVSEALSMSASTPARVGRISGRQRGLNTGEKADLIAFRWDAPTSTMQIVNTVVAGQEVYSYPK
jgi:N-acetylglucosamine-6-phosphate deacetylase